MMRFQEADEIVLRGYQADAIEALRDGIRRGTKRQILCAGTGAGKTVMAASLLKQANEKGAYALFLVDRVTLVKQTSETLDRYGVPHGIVQGLNERWSPRENVQVCSVQTLARRELPRDPSLIIYDEAHCQFKATLDYMDRHPGAVKIGLTATPFTAGMARHWDGIINVRATRLLIGDGVLIEPTIYVAKSPDDAAMGLNKFGEFSDESASAAGIQIIGDVVQEWVKKTHEHFGGPAKTIVFSPTVEHGRELCAAFNAAGYNFQQISYLDKSEAERDEKIAEFRRPDSIITGLVSCGVLTKGFDVPDTLIGVSCKPYRKSLSSHMQEIGRIMRSAPGKDKAIWLCLARDSKVLTNRGLIPIQFVTKHDKVWDGENFVSHGGAVCKGVRNVITYQGLTATPDHLVHTMDGWRTFGDCAREQITITQTGFGGAAIRLSRDHFAGRVLAWSKAEANNSCRLRVRDLWVSVSRLAQQLAERPHQRLSDMQPACAGVSTVALQSGASAEEPLHEPEKSYVECIWRAWNRVQVRRGEARYALDHGEFGDTGGLQVQGPGSDRPGWSLRAWKYSLATQATELDQSKRESGDREDASIQDCAPRSSIRRLNSGPVALVGNELRGHCFEVSPEIGQTKREVWDILNAGPNNRFTCEGLLVHNCHAGNIERFALDMFDVWEHGAGDLSSAEKQDKKPRERNEETREKVVCPECGGALRGNLCMACGWERPARSGIVAVDGVMTQFDPAAMGIAPRDGLRAEVIKDPRAVWNGALAYALDHCPRDENKARRWAYGVWRGVYPAAKLPRGWFDAERKPCLPEAYALAEREVKRYRKGQR